MPLCVCHRSLIKNSNKILFAYFDMQFCNSVWMSLFWFFFFFYIRFCAILLCRHFLLRMDLLTQICTESVEKDYEFMFHICIPFKWNTLICINLFKKKKINKQKHRNSNHTTIEINIPCNLMSTASGLAKSQRLFIFPHMKTLLMSIQRQLWAFFLFIVNVQAPIHTHSVGLYCCMCVCCVRMHAR